MGGSLRLLYEGLDLNAFTKFNDWGHYDYHRQFNFTYPFQLLVDAGWNFRKTKPLKKQFKVGTYLEYRTLDQYSINRNDETVFPNRDYLDSSFTGYEWAVAVYMKLGLL